MNVHRTFLTHSLHTAKCQLRHSSQAHGENYLQTKRPSAHKGCEWGWAGEVGGGASRDQASSPKPNTDGYWSASGIRAGSFQQPALMLREMGRTNKASTAKANPGRLLISGPKHSLIHLRGGVWRMSTCLLFSLLPLEENWHLSKRAIRL